MPLSENFTIAICGGGLAGLLLANALHFHGLPCTVYEASESSLRGAVGGSVQLTPNGMTVLDSHDILPRLNPYGRLYTTARVHDGKGNVMSEAVFGNKKHFKYDSMRILRSKLITELSSACHEKGIDIVCNKRFSHVISEDPSAGVTFAFKDGCTAHASLLIGADGIWSGVRQNLFPEASMPVYQGITAIVGSALTADIAGMTSDNFGMYVGPRGTAIVGSHVVDDSELAVGFQRPYPDLGREGFTQLASDKTKLKHFLLEYVGDFNPVIQNALRATREDTIILWPLRTLPHLQTWRSAHNRVVLIADAAHAIPPVSGQGANQAFEDAHTLASVIAAAKDGSQDLDNALAFWQDMRMKRIARIEDLTTKLGKARATAAEKHAMQKGEAFEAATTEEGRLQQMRWLYAGVADQEREVEIWKNVGRTSSS